MRHTKEYACVVLSLFMKTFETLVTNHFALLTRHLFDIFDAGLFFSSGRIMLAFSCLFCLVYIALHQAKICRSAIIGTVLQVYRAFNRLLALSRLVAQSQGSAVHHVLMSLPDILENFSYISLLERPPNECTSVKKSETLFNRCNRYILGSFICHAKSSSHEVAKSLGLCSYS